MRNLTVLPRPGRLRAAQQPDAFTASLALFERWLLARDRGSATLVAYKTDVEQFIRWLGEYTPLERPQEIERTDATEYLASLAGLTGATRKRKLNALRAYFDCLLKHEIIGQSPIVEVEGIKAEKKVRSYLIPREYSAMLSAAAQENTRDYAILQVFLQTGLRVSELCNLEIADVDLKRGILRVNAGKGKVDREIPLEKKAVQAITRYLRERPSVPYDQLFLSRQYQQPLSARGVQKIVDKYRRLAGIEREISCHSLRHTFATYKASRGVSPFQLKEWLGHSDLKTTMLYVHLGRDEGAKMMEATSL